MKKIYYLSTCDTCKRIISELQLKEKDFTFQDIKVENIGPTDLDKIKEKVGSYEDLFSKRSRKYKSMEIAKKDLSEADYRNLILEEYTFLKRPFILYQDRVFIGNSPKVIQAAKDFIK